MHSSWKVRILLALGIAIILFGDYLGYGNGVQKQHDQQKRSIHEQNNFAEGSNHYYNRVEDEVETLKKWRIGERLRENCLPKLLCEMAAKPWTALTDKERDLLNLIKSTTMSLSIALTPTRWHFAAHMGQLLRNSDDIAPMGCSNLFPMCPFSSKKLLSLSNRFAFR